MFALEFKKALLDQKLKQATAAYRAGLSPANLTMKLGRDNLTEQDMIKLAEAINCDVEIRLIEKPKAEQKDFTEFDKEAEEKAKAEKERRKKEQQ